MSQVATNNNKPATTQAKEVAKISPLLPIAVLLASAAQCYYVLHVRLMGSPNGMRELERICSTQVDKYFSHLDLNRGTCKLVEAFRAAVYNPATKVVLLEFAALVAVITLIAVISSNRSSAGFIVKWGSTAFLMVMQVLGGAVALPILFANVVWNSSSSARASFIPSGTARALYPALFCGFLAPSLVLVAPEPFQKGGILDQALAFWQIFPILVSIVTMVLAFCFTGIGIAKTTSDAMISTTFIVSTMDNVILFSFLMHAMSIYAAYDQGLTVMDFVPLVTMSSLAEVMHAFFVIDFLGFLVAVWTLIFYDTSRFAGVGKTSIR